MNQQKIWQLDFRVLLQLLQICWESNVSVVGITEYFNGKESVFLENFEIQGGKAEFAWKF